MALDIKKFVDRGELVCPVCGSTCINQDVPSHAESDVLEEWCDCEDCLAEWVLFYELSHLEIMEQGRKVA